MSHTQTDTTPAAIEAMLKDVTPGPWQAEDKQPYHVPCRVHTTADDHFGAFVAECGGVWHNQDTWEANARFIAWCRDGVPALAAELATARAERDRAIAGWEKSLDDRIDALDRAEKATTELAALRKEVERLREQIRTARAAERAEIIEALRDEAVLTPCHKDAIIVHDCADLVEANFGYDDAETLKESRTAEPLGHGVTADDFGGEA